MVRQEAVYEIADQSAPYPFRVSLLWHAFLVNGRVWSSQDNVEKNGTLICSTCKGKDAMEKQTLNHRKDRNERQVKTGWYTWAKTARNPAILVHNTRWQTDIAISGLQMAPKAPKVSLIRNLVTRIHSLKKRYRGCEIYKWCRRERMFQKANAYL